MWTLAKIGFTLLITSAYLGAMGIGLHLLFHTNAPWLVIALLSAFLLGLTLVCIAFLVDIVWDKEL
jgi:hypothetical protein